MRFAVIILLLLSFNLSLEAQESCYGLYFDGVDDYVYVPHIQEYEIGEGDYTVEAFVYSEVVKDYWIPMILSNRGTDHNKGFTFSILDWIYPTREYDGNLLIRLNQTNYYAYPSGEVESIHDGYFHHIAFSRQRIAGTDSSYLYFYNDGRLITSYKVPLVDLTLNQGLVMGIDFANSANTAYKGYMRNIKFWSRSILKDEMQELYNKEPDFNDKTLIGYWKLDEAEGQEVQDYSLNKNNGLLGSTSSTQAIDPVHVNLGQDICPQINLITTGWCDGDSAAYAVDESSKLLTGWTLLSNANQVMSTNDTIEIIMNGSETLMLNTNYPFTSSVELAPKNIKDCIEIYDFVSPNDDGLNDYFSIEPLERYSENELWIYDRWGKQVMHEKNYTNNWGDNVDEGVYYYLLLIDGVEKIQGNILVK